MPQPYKLDKPVNFSSNAILQRPKLAAHIGFVNTIWARIDYWLAVIVVKSAAAKQLKILFDTKHLPIDEAKSALVHKTATIAANIYLSLSGSAAKDSVLEEMLGDKAFLEFKPLFKRVKSIRKQRNRFIHGICGIVEDLPDSIIVQELEDSILATMNTKQMPCFEYKESDFLELGNEISLLIRELDTFQASEWKELLPKDSQPRASGPDQQQPPPESPKKVL